jgi:hypothetical protein
VVGRKLDHDLPGLGVVADHDVTDPLLGRRGGLDGERMIPAIRLSSFMQAGGISLRFRSASFRSAS